jgi:hypothetical protein
VVGSAEASSASFDEGVVVDRAGGGDDHRGPR